MNVRNIEVSGDVVSFDVEGCEDIEDSNICVNLTTGEIVDSDGKHIKPQNNRQQFLVDTITDHINPPVKSEDENELKSL